ncbi:alpha-galactosidase [Streptococcus pneumoniae]|nr:alpha-galactosidase [Streptococcus pneumoniae]
MPLHVYQFNTVHPISIQPFLCEEGLYKLQENGEVYSGAELMYAGLTVILSQGDFLSRQYIFRKL